MINKRPLYEDIISVGLTIVALQMFQRAATAKAPPGPINFKSIDF